MGSQFRVGTRSNELQLSKTNTDLTEELVTSDSSKFGEVVVMLALHLHKRCLSFPKLLSAILSVDATNPLRTPALLAAQRSFRLDSFFNLLIS